MIVDVAAAKVDFSSDGNTNWAPAPTSSSKEWVVLAVRGNAQHSQRPTPKNSRARTLWKVREATDLASEVSLELRKTGSFECSHNALRLLQRGPLSRQRCAGTIKKRMWWETRTCAER